MASCQPVSTAVPCLSCTMTALRVMVTVQSASHSGPKSTKIWRKPGMRCPLVGNPDGRWGKSRSPVPVDCWNCPVAMPTVTFGAARSMLTTGESMEKYMSVAPESTMPVDCFGSTLCCRVWLSGILGNVRVDMSRVELKLA